MQDKMPSWQVDLNAAGHHWRWEGERTGCEYCFPKGGVSENDSLLTLTRKSNNLSYAYFEALLHCGSQSVTSSMKRMPKAVAVINGGFLAPSFERGRMGHFQMQHQSWPTVLHLGPMPAPLGCSPAMVPRVSPLRVTVEGWGSGHRLQRGKLQPSTRKDFTEGAGAQRGCATSVFAGIEHQPGKGSEQPGVS